MLRVLAAILVITLVPLAEPARLVLQGDEALSVAQASKAAIEEAHKAWHESSSEWLRATRREDFEDDWLRFQKFHGQPLRKDFYFFAVSFMSIRISDDGSKVLSQQ